jgi:3-hydroxybutyryl-CoA dehydrogenase
MSNMHHELHHLHASAGLEACFPGRVGIVGASAIGIGIAIELLDADVPVTLYEADTAALAAALAQIRSGWAGTQDKRLALLAGTVNFHHLKDADLVVDASATPGREALFQRLDQTAKHGAILATAAADTGVDRLAGSTRRPHAVLGLKTGSGEAWEMRPGRETSNAAVATVSALARRLHGAARRGA